MFLGSARMAADSWHGREIDHSSVIFERRHHRRANRARQWKRISPTVHWVDMSAQR